MTATGWVKETINAGLRPLGVQVIRGHSTDPAVQSFVSARKTIAAAHGAGLSVGDYIDATHAEPGVTAGTVDAMLRLSELEAPVERVCEIGPGTGRYMEKVIAALRPAVYEVYETAHDWLPHLAMLPNAVLQPCDGRSLKSTASSSVDLVHAHKVFVYLPIWAVVGYIDEMARVVRPGGTVAFDVVTEDCLDQPTLDNWQMNGTIFRPVPRQWTIDRLESSGLVFAGHHTVFLKPGNSELLVFRRP